MVNEADNMTLLCEPSVVKFPILSHELILSDTADMRNLAIEIFP